jgi:hypothetical protein
MQGLEGCRMRFFALWILIVAAATCSPNTCRGQPCEAADEPSYIEPEAGTPPARLSLGAGYERYNAEWTADIWGMGLGKIEQDRFYVRVGYLVGRRLLVTGTLGAADAATSDPLFYDAHPRGPAEYGFQVFGNLSLLATPLGVPPGRQGAALDLLVGLSAFGPYRTEFDGYIYSEWQCEEVDFTARLAIEDMWEASAAALLRVGNGTFTWRFGWMLYRSRAMRSVRIETVWGADGGRRQIEAEQEFGALIALQLTPWGATGLEFEVLTPPTTRFSLALSTPLCR